MATGRQVILNSESHGNIFPGSGGEIENESTDDENFSKVEN